MLVKMNIPVPVENELTPEQVNVDCCYRVVDSKSSHLFVNNGEYICILRMLTDMPGGNFEKVVLLPNGTIRKLSCFDKSMLLKEIEYIDKIIVE